MGVELKCVPWTDADVLAAVTTCYRRARHMLTDDGQLLSRALRFFTMACVDSRGTHPSADFRPISGGRWLSETALRQRVVRDQDRSFQPAALGWATAGIGSEMAVGTGRDDGSPCPEWQRIIDNPPGDSVIWPDGERRRSLKIAWPLTQLPAWRL